MESGFPTARSPAYAEIVASMYARAAGCGGGEGGESGKGGMADEGGAAAAADEGGAAAAATTASATALLACLRNKSLAVLEAAAAVAVAKPSNKSPFAGKSWGPVVDGVDITDDPLRLLAAGRVNGAASVVAGTNTDEGTVFVYVSRSPF